MNLLLHMDFAPRIVQNTDWATLLFVFAFAVIAVTRNVFAVRFYDYIRLFQSDKYLKIYKDTSNLKSWFTLSMFVVQMISLSFIIHIFLSALGYSKLNNFIDFIGVFNFFTFFVLLKYLIEKIVSVCLDLEDFVEQYNLIKVNYRTYLGLILLPVAIIFFYNSVDPEIALYLVVGITVLINIILYIMILRNYQNIFRQYLFYFILYLCTFEIAPYFLLYKWFVIFKT